MRPVVQKPRIWADFNNTDALGRLRLNVAGAVEDLDQLGEKLRDGLGVTFYGLELEADGVLLYSQDEQMWIGELNH